MCAGLAAKRNVGDVTLEEAIAADEGEIDDYGLSDIVYAEQKLVLMHCVERDKVLPMFC
jgi:hypothetical protein